jgi:hypothetical protein
LRRRYLKQEAFAGANSAGNRGEFAKLIARARRRIARDSASAGP